ncbi:MAG: glutamine amidotransferase-related protein [Gemmatimonadales bacterium]
MICYVDLEHPERGPSRLSEGPGATQRKADLLTFKARFERLSGAPCVLIHYTQVERALLDRLAVRAVVVSGHSTLIDHYDRRDLAPLLEIIRETPWPILGLCGGHQLIGLAFGETSAPMGALAAGEVDPKPDVAPGMRKEWGPSRVRISGHDPLFDGLGETVVVEQRHFWELKAVPAGFVGLAGSDACAVQAIRHVRRPLYGVQFHPERYSELHPDGRTILVNFFRLAGSTAPRSDAAALARA